MNSAVQLSRVERLASLENVIERSVQATWLAAAEIYQDELWKEAGHASFVDYCKARWNWEKANAYEVAKAGKVVSGLLNAGIAENSLPTTIRQIRELAKVPETVRAEVVQEAQAQGPLNDKSVREAARRRIAPPCQAGLRATLNLERDRVHILESFIAKQDELISELSLLLSILAEQSPNGTVAAGKQNIGTIALKVRQIRSEKLSLIG